MQELELDQIPTDGREHELSVYMQDTGWPDAPLDDYIELWDKEYWHSCARRLRQEAAGYPGCFQVPTELGSGPRRY